MNIRKDIKKDDVVIVLAGDKKGATGKVLKVLPKEHKVLVEGVNVVKRHQKPNRDNSGGIVDKTMPIHLSNVSLYDEASKSAVKVGFRNDEKLGKVRFNKKTDAILN